MAAGMYSGAEMSSAFAAGLVGKRLGSGFLLFAGSTFQTVGFLVYGFSQSGWMVVLARGLIGFNGGITLTAMYSYNGKSAYEYNNLCESIGKKKRPGLERQLIMISNLVGMSTMIPTIGEMQMGL